MHPTNPDFQYLHPPYQWQSINDQCKCRILETFMWTCKRHRVKNRSRFVHLHQQHTCYDCTWQLCCVQIGNKCIPRPHDEDVEVLGGPKKGGEISTLDLDFMGKTCNTKVFPQHWWISLLVSYNVRRSFPTRDDIEPQPQPQIVRGIEILDDTENSKRLLQLWQFLKHPSLERNIFRINIIKKRK